MELGMGIAVLQSLKENIFKNKGQSIKITAVTVVFILFLMYRFILVSGDLWRMGKNGNFSESLENFFNISSLESYCFIDRWLLKFSQFINVYASQNLYFRDFTLILSSNTLDVLFIAFMFYFIKNGNCLRTIISLLCFYGFRGIIQNNFLLTFYPTYLFDYPGFFSIVVPFTRNSDFFYSGHCGCALILSLSFRDLTENYFYYFGLFVTFLQFFVMTSITRAHYIIDAISGLIVAHYFYIVANKICKFLESRKNSEN